MGKLETATIIGIGGSAIGLVFGAVTAGEGLSLSLLAEAEAVRLEGRSAEERSRKIPQEGL